MPGCPPVTRMGLDGMYFKARLGPETNYIHGVLGQRGQAPGGAQGYTHGPEDSDRVMDAIWPAAQQLPMRCIRMLSREIRGRRTGWGDNKGAGGSMPNVAHRRPRNAGGRQAQPHRRLARIGRCGGVFEFVFGFLRFQQDPCDGSRAKARGYDVPGCRTTAIEIGNRSLRTSDGPLS